MRQRRESDETEQNQIRCRGEAQARKSGKVPCDERGETRESELAGKRAPIQYMERSAHA